MNNDLQLLKNFYKENFHTKNELLVIEDYLQAFQVNDENRITEYSELGSTIRHRIMNINHYYNNLKYGFTHKDLDQYGWLKSGEFIVERIEFETNKTNHNPYIELGKGLNGKWSYGYSFSMGASGGGCKVHVFREPINSRDECFELAISYAKQEYQQSLNRNDSTNFNEVLINQVLKSIEKITCSSNQLALF